MGGVLLQAKNSYDIRPLSVLTQLSALRMCANQVGDPGLKALRQATPPFPVALHARDQNMPLLSSAPG